MAARRIFTIVAMANMAAIVASMAISVPAYADQFNWTLIEEAYSKVGNHSAIQDNFGVLASVDAFAGPVSYGNYAINAPFCNGVNTHEGCSLFTDGTFDPNRCADACTAHTTYSLAHGLTNRPCRFFNTYKLMLNGAIFGQYCSLYTQTFDRSWATNPGSIGADGNNYTVADSVGYYNSTDPATCPTTTTTHKHDGKQHHGKHHGKHHGQHDDKHHKHHDYDLGLDHEHDKQDDDYHNHHQLSADRSLRCQLSANVGTMTNAMGYNSLDNYLYASNYVNTTNANTWTLIRIGGTGAYTNVTSLPTAPAAQNWLVGDVDESGQYWASYYGQQWFQLDLKPGSATYGQVVASGTASPSLQVVDWAYVPGAGNYLWALGYNSALTSTTLMRFDRTAHTWTALTNFGNVAGQNTFGAVYAGPNQTLLGTENTSGQLWKFQLPVVGTTKTQLGTGAIRAHLLSGSIMLGTSIAEGKEGRGD
ncbi:Uu.00g114640.m01.CDS01 [Anthostomella pinea]|uniref:Uu.00g114640.m01.CDS01 n=1 Tax=Anthostomella pinea TaxID=933095 RepID=A0AAI8VFQ5_9PEZI|nr:Uu.00g114640.m01.CDS01 [Anthostomella pinea]